jgi:hypothetical protein
MGFVVRELAFENKTGLEGREVRLDITFNRRLTQSTNQ